MKLTFTIILIATYAMLTGATASFFQQSEHSAHHGSTVAATAAATASYAGQQTRDIKALSAGDANDLIEGKGMGLAKAAELNGYPGPVHVLELADALQLAVDQRASTARLLTQHKTRARMLGIELVQAERELDAEFGRQEINAEKLATLTQQIGAMQAAVRFSHLETHLQQSRLLTTQQVAQYQLLRGYGTTGSSTLQN